MKNIIQYCLLAIAVSIQAQDFKPYKVESGKITYENLKYSTVSGYSYKNGVETSYSKQVPYVAEQVIYYWDEFGDIAFEETYKISSFGGKLLPEKVKISERLWIDEHRYYFNAEKNKVSDDPFHLRIKCREHFQYYQIKDSWIETLYMGAEKTATKDILGKEADYYRIDNYQDIYAWKGLVLKTEDFSTRGSNGPRFNIERAKNAIEIDTISKVSDTLFNPIWLKREKLYTSLGEQRIVELFDGRQEVLEQVDSIDGIELQKNDIVLFVTSKLTVGKMQVLEIDKNKQLIIKYDLYSYGKIIDGGDSFKIKNNTTVNIDNPHYKKTATKDLDFKWSVTNKATLFSTNSGFFLLKPSRTKALTIKKYRRKK
ncbi:MAG: hypothetical protein HKP59_08925 [Lutibacter sp.]|uniref:hypothetical protein n=1 Tax=Lutibacter sp. TaxID=1925666 RepID=UPI00179D17F3|nr:hypothetical protein [Lutibacter sp.]MBT8317739.1 hypothetical protein [Lutibacter sp.]NNJ58597.1 hypothetical protein [Lutibacter sp.]